jgi:hypothetical protein
MERSKKLFLLMKKVQQQQQDERWDVWRVQKSESKECVKGNKMCLRSFIFACRNLRLLFITLHLFDVPRNYVVYGFSERWALISRFDRHYTSPHLTKHFNSNKNYKICNVLITPFFWYFYWKSFKSLIVSLSSFNSPKNKPKNLTQTLLPTISTLCIYQKK